MASKYLQMVTNTKAISLKVNKKAKENLPGKLEALTKVNSSEDFSILRVKNKQPNSSIKEISKMVYLTAKVKSHSPTLVHIKAHSLLANSMDLEKEYSLTLRLSTSAGGSKELNTALVK
jgi:hypothetical protein